MDKVFYSESGFFDLNPPLVASPELAKVVKVQLGKPGNLLEIKTDNRYKDGNIRIVDGVVRGNAKTVIPKIYAPFTQAKGGK